MIIDWYVFTVIVIVALSSGLVGYLIGTSRSGKKSTQAGSFIINYDDPEKDFLGIKLDKDLPELERSRYISFRVIVEKDENSNPKISQRKVS